MKAIVSTFSALVIAGTLSIAHSQPPGGGKGPGSGGQGHGGPGQVQGGGNHQHPSPEDVFKKFDTDGDGKLSLEEFKSGHRPGHPPGGPGGAGGAGGAGKGPGGGSGAGKRPDGGAGGAGDGQGPGGGNQHPSREEIFKKLDTNGDGFLSLDEFKAGRPPRGPGGGKGGGAGNGPGGKPAAGS